MGGVCGQTSSSFSSFRTHPSFGGSTTCPESAVRFGAGLDSAGGSRKHFRVESRPTPFTAARRLEAWALRSISPGISSSVLGVPCSARRKTLTSRAHEDVPPRDVHHQRGGTPVLQSCAGIHPR